MDASIKQHELTKLNNNVSWEASSSVLPPSFFWIFAGVNLTKICKNDILVERKVLEAVDQAEYVSPAMILGRDKDLGALNKSCLSTGCKTLLNIISSPLKCFDVIECGVNVLQLLPLVTSGHVLWREPALPRVMIQNCDIMYQGVVYHNFIDFLDKAAEV